MAKDTLPQLSEALISGLASGSSFERGTSYYHGGAILEPVCQGMELRAECQGSQLLSTVKNAPTGTEGKRTHPGRLDGGVRSWSHLLLAAWSVAESARPAVCLSAGNSRL
jgi:hypothetical protein